MQEILMLLYFALPQCRHLSLLISKQVGIVDCHMLAC